MYYNVPLAAEAEQETQALVPTEPPQPPRPRKRGSALGLLLILAGIIVAVFGVYSLTMAKWIWQEQAATTWLILAAVLIVGGALARK